MDCFIHIFVISIYPFGLSTPPESSFWFPPNILRDRCLCVMSVVVIKTMNVWVCLKDSSNGTVFPHQFHGIFATTFIPSIFISTLFKGAIQRFIVNELWINLILVISRQGYNVLDMMGVRILDVRFVVWYELCKTTEMFLVVLTDLRKGIFEGLGYISSVNATLLKISTSKAFETCQVDPSRPATAPPASSPQQRQELNISAAGIFLWRCYSIFKIVATRIPDRKCLLILMRWSRYKSWFDILLNSLESIIPFLSKIMQKPLDE